MKKLLVTLEIGIRNVNDDGVYKTDTEIKDALRIYDHDVIDGFELTTQFSDCENTEDFYLKDAKIVRVKTQAEIDYLKQLEANEKFRHEDLQESINLLYKVNQHFNGYPSDLADWIRSIHEINEDFEERTIDVADNVCDSLKAVEKLYGYDIAKEIYDDQMAVLPNEITEVGKYLSLGGDRERVNELLNSGFFMEDKSADEMREFIKQQTPAPVMTM